MKIMNTKRRLSVLGVLVALCLVGSLVTPALAGAPPPMNHQFYGEVTSQGAPVDEGVPVVAKVNGEPCGETTVFIRDAESRYNFEVSGEVASPGDPIKFWVDGVEAALYDVGTGESRESYPFGPPDYRTELNLTVTIVDTTAPTVVITELIPDPTNVNTPTFTGTATDELSNIASVEYKVDDGEWLAADAVDGAFDSLSEEYTFTTAELLDGVHTVYVRATDAVTNTSTEPYVSDEFVVDTAAPAVGITIADPINLANVTAVSVTITSDEDGTYTYIISDNVTELTDTGAITAGVAVELSLDLSTLADDTITADASVEDAALNIGQAPQASATKDTVEPVVEITSPSEGALLNTLDVTIEGTATEVAEVVVDGETAPVIDGAFSIAPTLTEGPNSVTATATDAAGNVGSDTVNFTIDVVTHTLTMLVVGEGTVTPESGDYPEGDMTITATIPVSGWEFAGWSTEDMAEIADPTSAETTLTLDKDKTVTATFTEVVTYDLTVASTAGGTVTDPGEDAFTYNAGIVVNLVAVADPDYTFGWWSGDVVADANAASTTITMDSAKSVVANFIEFSAPENVSVTEMDPGVESITVTDEPVEELDVTQMPAGIDPQEAYVVAPTGIGSFTLIFSDVSNASDIRVYKVVDDTWTLLEVTVVDATTIKVTMDVADPILVFALPPATIGTVNLPAGWNLLSTPIKLDADSDSLEQILGESIANIEVSYRWDTQSKDWAIPTGYEISPLEAVYLKVSSGASATAEFIPSGELSWLPSRELQPGLNLIGPAPAFDSEAGVFPDMPLDQALITIAEAGNLTGYTIVVSPEHNQLGWTYAPGGQIQDLLPFKGYWVVMENADTMYGFSYTPVTP